MKITDDSKKIIDYLFRNHKVIPIHIKDNSNDWFIDLFNKIKSAKKESKIIYSQNYNTFQQKDCSFTPQYRNVPAYMDYLKQSSTQCTHQSCSELENIIKNKKIDEFYEWQSVNAQHIPQFHNNSKIDSYSNKYLYNPFISTDIQQEVENNHNICQENSMYDNSKHFKLISHNTKQTNSYSKKQNILIFNIISVMNRLSGKNMDDNIVINVWNTKKRKVMPIYYNVLSAKNVNSGSTLPGYFINIWRQEELMKVLIHELVHCLHLDFRDNGTIEKYCRQKFNIDHDSPIYINEAYTELLAIIIHSSYISKNIQTVYKILEIELAFSFFQTAKLLTLFKFDSFQNFIQSNSNKSWKQKTDSFSYFFVKTALLFSINNFIEFIQKNNNGNLQFNRGNLNSLLHLIDTSVFNPNFIQRLNKELQNYNNSNLLIHSTLRMTAIEKR